MVTSYDKMMRFSLIYKHTRKKTLTSILNKMEGRIEPILIVHEEHKYSCTGKSIQFYTTSIRDVQKN